MELIKHSQERGLLQNLKKGITPDGNLNVALVNTMELNHELKKFKSPSGEILFEKLISLPIDQRIYKLVETDPESTIGVISVALTLAMETMNVTRRMNNAQIVDLAEAIADDSESDKIALEDLLLFLQRLTRGYYPELYEGIDQVKFLQRFNQYRDERWEEGIKIRDRKHEEFKQLGGNESYGNKRGDESAFGEYLSGFRNRIQAQKDEIKRLREQQKRNNQSQ